jgi:hypothetical protein
MLGGELVGAVALTFTWVEARAEAPALLTQSRMKVVLADRGPTVALPDTGLLPDQPPDAVQDEALTVDQVDGDRRRRAGRAGIRDAEGVHRAVHPVDHHRHLLVAVAGDPEAAVDAVVAHHGLGNHGVAAAGQVGPAPGAGGPAAADVLELVHTAALAPVDERLALAGPLPAAGTPLLRDIAGLVQSDTTAVGILEVNGIDPARITEGRKHEQVIHGIAGRSGVNLVRQGVVVRVRPDSAVRVVHIGVELGERVGRGGRTQRPENIPVAVITGHAAAIRAQIPVAAALAPLPRVEVEHVGPELVGGIGGGHAVLDATQEHEGVRPGVVVHELEGVGRHRGTVRVCGVGIGEVEGPGVGIGHPLPHLGGHVEGVNLRAQVVVMAAAKDQQGAVAAVARGEGAAVPGVQNGPETGVAPPGRAAATRIDGRVLGSIHVGNGVLADGGPGALGNAAHPAGRGAGGLGLRQGRREDGGDQGKNCVGKNMTGDQCTCHLVTFAWCARP